MPLHMFQNINPMANSSPSAPPKQAQLPRGDLALNGEKAGPPLYLGTYPTPVCIAENCQNLLPCTPPNKHATLPTLGSPAQQFNFADFVDETPVPAQST
jgi:hypothetical protein